MNPTVLKRLLFCLAGWAVAVCPSAFAVLDGQAVINEPVALEDFKNQDVVLDDTAVFSGDSFTASNTETVYYVSSSEGSDAHDGLSPSSPWDLATFSTHKEPDTIYLFKRGDVFRGEITHKSKKVNTKFGAYGTGTRPLFLGSLAINGWQQTEDVRIPASVRAEVYEADLSNAVFGGTDGMNGIRYLFWDSRLMTVARYPNVDSPDETNWLNITEKRGTYSFYDEQLPSYKNTGDYWTGATLRARTYSWQYSVRDIIGYTDGVITTEEVNTPWYPRKGWGYFIDNKIEELDHPGEWYYDNTAKKIFFYPPLGLALDDGLAEGVTLSTGINIYWQQHTVEVKDLSFKHYLANCVNINSSDNVIIENVNMQYCRQGIYIYNSNNSEIRNNHIDNSFETGINLGKHDGIIITGNTISNNGMFHTYGSFNTALTQGKGINSLSDTGLTVSSLNISNNSIINSSYSAIEIGTDYAVVKNNYIQGSLLNINDGGAVTLRGSNIQILDNIIINVYGNINDGANGYTDENSTSKHTSYGMGIFDYSDVQGNIISGNTVAYARDIGIMIQNGVNYQVNNNVTYGNEVQIQAKKGGDGVTIQGNTIFTADNIITGAGKYAAHKGLDISGIHTNLTVDNNLYASLCSESYISYDGNGYDLDSFLHFNGSYDTNSSSHAASFPKFAVASVVKTLVDENFESCENPDQWSNTSALSGGKCSDDTSKTGSKSFVKEDATVAPTFFRIKDEIFFEK
ncbi:MAG: right-handed parallel beta-helix repeat-containing protein, partial [Candidatus Electrothrix sp. AR5]|nr:right-handed parallel beta-helix repeat-containing protein [Candidatus Electrothrix sp. AR5]